MVLRSGKCVLFDWGDTLMVDFPEFTGSMATWPEVKVVDGADEVLERLRSTVRIGLATNATDSSEPEIWMALRRVGLDKLIDHVYCFQRVGWKKPAPEFFAFVLQDLQLPPEDVVVVGDNFEVDVAGANQAGLRAVWLNHSSEEREGIMHYTIRHLSELPMALEQFWAPDES